MARKSKAFNIGPLFVWAGMSWPPQAHFGFRAGWDAWRYIQLDTSVFEIEVSWEGW